MFSYLAKPFYRSLPPSPPRFVVPRPPPPRGICQALGRLTEHPDDLSEPDVVLLTQHDAVLTLGTASTLDNLKFSPGEAPFDVVRTERGGEVTYHGPGQVIYGLAAVPLCCTWLYTTESEFLNTTQKRVLLYPFRAIAEARV